MFDTLFGADMPLPVKFFFAFAVVLALIGATAWAVRRFGAGRLGGGGARGRQPRLAVIDYASVDGRRRLILVRRDNVEHLLMIGGPTDVVVEPNIVRATAAPRDLATRPTAGLDALPRAIPLPETNGGSWPLAPEATVGLRAPRVEPLPDEFPLPPPPPKYEPASPKFETPKAEAPPTKAETPKIETRPQRDTLAALADELATRPAPPPPPPRKPAMSPRPQPAEPRMPAPQAAAPIIPPAPEPPSAADQSLADMAQRLEAALRKPGEPRAAPPRAPAAEPAQTSEPPMPRPQRQSESRPPRPEAKPGQGKTPVYDSLEQEMASLLGRQTKT